MPLTPAEKQRRYRERRKLNKEKDEENKRKDVLLVIYEIWKYEICTASYIFL